MSATDSVLRDVDRAAKRYASERKRLDTATAALRAEIRSAHQVGVSEVALAKRAGVNRGTIRDWLGK